MPLSRIPYPYFVISHQMTRVLLSLGSNTDQPAKQLARAIKHISNLRQTSIIKLSKPIVTPPWGKTDQPDFLNMSLLIDTDMKVAELMENILIIELKMGRMRQEKWGPRNIDIDIILYGDVVLNDPLVIVPHPHMHERRFVLEPSAEIAPEMIHPLLKKSVLELLNECREPAAVTTNT